MKKLLLIICIAFSSCQTLKVGGNITSVAKTDSTVSIGFYIHGEGQLQPKLDSLYYGYPVYFGEQLIQIIHTDNSFDINGLLNFKTK